MMEAGNTSNDFDPIKYVVGGMLLAIIMIVIMLNRI
jgi:hypothetical protein